METFKPKYDRGNFARFAAACSLITALFAGEPAAGNGVAEREQTRREAAIQEAQELLVNGDESYTTGNYEDAVKAYAGARELLPDAPVVAELRLAVTERYAQASVEHAKILSKKGDVAGAKAVVDRVLAESVAPENPGALTFRAQLDDPIRTNPALTAEHGKNVDAVRRLLYTAEGAFNLGDYDKSKSLYEKALRIDPTNSAARRGLEKVAGGKSVYQKAAYDHTRAELLGQVDATWETAVPPTDGQLPIFNQDNLDPNSDPVSVRNKLDRIIIPKFALDQASLEEALDFLRIRAVENDTTEPDPARKGVNFRLNLGAADSPLATTVKAMRFDLQLSQVPLSMVLKYLTEITRTSFSSDEYSVVISPLGSTSQDLMSRTFRVPPDFLSSMGSNSPSGAAATEPDPFGTPAPSGLLEQRTSVQDALIQQGVAFPPGSSATYNRTTNSLRILNTPTNLEFISQIVETVTKTEPVMVSVKLTMIKVQQTRLEELGFDWLLDNFGFGGAGWVPGSSTLNLSGGVVGNGQNLNDIALPAGATSRNPITAGNRSGDSAISGNSVDAILNNSGGRQSNNRAPGVLSVNGMLSNASVQTLMRGLDQKKGVDLLAQPSVVTRSGQSSSIAIIREFIYATEYEPPELPSSSGGGFGSQATPVTPATPTAFEKKDVGVTLEVLPVVDENKTTVNVTLNPVFSDFDGFVNYGSPINAPAESLFSTASSTVQLTPNAILMPVFSVQRMSTNVDVADGATMVVGGLMQESVQNVEDQTPILGNIPVLGRLFQSKARQASTTAIIFLVNVEVMDPTGRKYRDR